MTLGPQLLNAQPLIPRPDGAIFALGGAYDTVTGHGVVRVVRPDGLIDTSFVSDIGSVLPPDFRITGSPTLGSYPPNATLLSRWSTGRCLLLLRRRLQASVRGLVALEDDGHHDPTFGIDGLASTPAVAICIVDHFADDSLRVRGVTW